MALNQTSEAYLFAKYPQLINLHLIYCVDSTKNSISKSIPFSLSCQSRADFGGVWIGPFKGERSALLGLHGIDAAEVALCQIVTRAVWTTLEDKTLAIRRDFGLAFNELGLIHSKKRRDTRDLRVRDAHDPVFDAAACPAHPALELVQFHLFASFAFFAAKH